MFKYNNAALGGTFDHFHKGHQTLLKYAFEKSENIIVGITADDFVLEKDFSSLIEPFNIRRQSVLDYALSIRKDNQLSIVKLNNIFGPTLVDKNIDCLVVSPLTKTGAELINKERKNHELPILKIEICQLELSVDNRAISSTRIRAGEISRQGFVYRSLLEKNIKLSNNQINQARLPFGEIYSDIYQLKHNITTKNKIIAVGDMATRVCLEQEIPLAFGVFDNLEKRQQVTSSVRDFLKLTNIINAINKPGTISLDLTNKLQQAIQENKYVEVEGEEDLAVIPLTLSLPLDSIILYGQPNMGIVLVQVTENKKEWVRNLLCQLEQ